MHNKQQPCRPLSRGLTVGSYSSKSPLARENLKLSVAPVDPGPHAAFKEWIVVILIVRPEYRCVWEMLCGGPGMQHQVMLAAWYVVSPGLSNCQS